MLDSLIKSKLLLLLIDFFFTFICFLVFVVVQIESSSSSFQPTLPLALLNPKNIRSTSIHSNCHQSIRTQIHNKDTTRTYEYPYKHPRKKEIHLSHHLLKSDKFYHHHYYFTKYNSSIKTQLERVRRMVGTSQEDDFGDDSFLMDFDPDEAILASQKRRNQVEKNINKSTNTGGSGGVFDNKPKSLSSEIKTKPKVVHNPYSTNQSKSGSTRSTTSSYIHNNSSSKNHPFGKNSKFSIGNIDTTKYATLPERKETNNLSSFSAISPTSLSSSSKRLSSSSHSETIHSHDDKKIKLQSTHETIQTSQDNINPDAIMKYNQTLEKHFGYTSFRSGQLEIIHSIIQHQRDSSVFWSTGSGKSLCYQIPPLHMKKIAIIVSPLISLMEDQVSKLNGLLLQDGKKKNDGNNDGDIAVYLGSGQLDRDAEYRALKGGYLFVYLTPEKLLSQNGNFLNSLGELHGKKTIRNNSLVGDNDGRNICLIAIDERFGNDTLYTCVLLYSVSSMHNLTLIFIVLFLFFTLIPLSRT